MTDKEEPDYSVWIMGNWDAKRADLELGPGVKDAAEFHRGTTNLGLEPEVAHALRMMLVGQERWRMSVENGLKRVVAHLSEKSNPHIKAMQVPANDPVEQAKMWRAEGAYEGYVESGEHIMKVMENGWVLK